ncbi:MAG: molybdopterin molybdenumtransferase MoeA [Planctomycetaceae bacterium]|nr:molybdopterin molybdenumtransferase MoeA [Planctomycetaceae bacterium]
MLTVSQAIAAILAEVQPLHPVRVPLADALGLVLAEPAIAQLDSPPFDKALMDGFAVRSADLPEGRATLRVIEEVMAGQVPRRALAAGEATRIMTGAPVPAGADCVVQVEHTRLVPGAGPIEVAIETGGVKPGKNLLKRGASTAEGECVLPAGRMLRPQELGALAELGSASVAVIGRPRVAVLATGDELVSLESQPGPGQIRNSNETMLVAQLRQMGVTPVPLGIARDNAADLRERISAGLTHDVLLLSGGVSAGQLDLVPSVLADLGVRQVFHKVRLKPGQPLWFGVYDRPKSIPHWVPPVTETRGASRCHVFGLPGNPVSSMVCTELFARRALRQLMGITPVEPAPVRARLTCEHFNHGNRPTYHPAALEWTQAGAVVAPVPWIGSADLSATVCANAMALFSDADRHYRAGEMVDVFLW